MNIVSVLMFLCCYLLTRGKLRITVKSSDYSVRREDNVTFSCQTNDENATVSFQIGKGSPKGRNYFGKRVQQYGQSFYIIDIRWNEGGEIRCNASNEREEIRFEDKDARVGNLNVIPGPCNAEPIWVEENEMLVKNKLLSEAILIKLNRRQFVLEKNDELSARCLVETRSSEPLTVIKFSGLDKRTRSFANPSYEKRYIQKLDKTRFTKRSYQFAMMKFKLKKVQLSDEGVYRCIRKLPRGSNCPETYTNLKVVVTKPQAPIINIESKEVVEGKNVLLECNVTASPIPSITWESKSGKVLKTCPPRSRKSQGGLSVMCQYELINVNRLLDLTYTCKATNSEGDTNSSLDLIVLFKPKVKGSQFDRSFRCEVTGNPTPNVKWQKCYNNGITRQTCKGTWIEVNSDERYKIHNAFSKGGHYTAVINSINFAEDTENGLYECFAENEVGNATRRFHLPPKIQGLKPVVTALICGLVVVTVMFILILLCYKKYLKHTYVPHLTPNKKFVYDHERSIFEQSIDLPYSVEWEFPRKRLEMKQMIGSGAFGEVWIAQARGIEALTPTDKSTGAIKRRVLLRLDRHISKQLFACTVKGDAWDNVMLVAAKTLKG